MPRLSSTLCLLLPFLALAFAVESPAQPTPKREIRILTIDGVINPLSARYLKNELEAAGRADSVEAAVLQLNTPGGLESSMREMTSAILGSRVPVLVHVTPSGGRAASAGMFITIAAHVAAMAPGTNIGAAHPVSIGSQGQPDRVMESKVVNDAAALARAIALERKRNAQWAEDAVKRSVSISAQEAVAQKVIDFVAADLKTLLASADGRKVTLAGGRTVTLNTRDTTLAQTPMGWTERLAQAITDPNITYLLMTVGLIGIVAELYNPGMLFPGITGAISLILAFAGLGSLPVNWAGVLLLILGVALLIFELQTEGIGFLGVAALVSFTLGSLILYRPFRPVSPSFPDVAVSPGWIAAVTLGILALMITAFRALLRVRKRPAAIGPESMKGALGRALSDLAPTGRVQLDSEEWSAIADTSEGTILEGEQVEVVAVEGVTLRVRRPLGRTLQAS